MCRQLVNVNNELVGVTYVQSQHEMHVYLHLQVPTELSYLVFGNKFIRTYLVTNYMTKTGSATCDCEKNLWHSHLEHAVLAPHVRRCWSSRPIGNLLPMNANRWGSGCPSVSLILFLFKRKF